MSVTIELRGLELFAHHGVLENERRAGQRFLFDVWLEASDDAASSDRLEDAVDYREVAAAVRDVSDRRTFQLLEGLAAAVADSLLARFPLVRVRVRVRKPDVQLGEPVEYAAVSVERARS
jgi:7,8-dihydroneopterin aldolase/epimerase/oxygenase